MALKEMLMENDFRDVVHAEGNDEKTYEDISAAPSDTEDMVSAIIGIVQPHVTEVWSPPRVTAMAHEYCLAPGCA